MNQPPKDLGQNIVNDSAKRKKRNSDDRFDIRSVLLTRNDGQQIDNCSRPDRLRYSGPDPNIPKLRLKIAYDGTPFAGWQIQDSNESIQGHIEKAVFQITGEQRRVVGAGRTDAGVHALGQVAHVSIEKQIDPLALKKALNAILPKEIRILQCDSIFPEFHAQISAIGKEYHYNICLDDVVLPFDRPYVWHYRKKLDIELLKEASKLFIGEHDFRGFSNALGGGLIKHNTVRTISRLDVIPTKTGLRLEFVGNGFLYKMVRNITGMLISIGSLRRDPSDVQRIFTSLNRQEAESGAPPQGLFLINVQYQLQTHLTHF